MNVSRLDGSTTTVSWEAFEPTPSNVVGRGVRKYDMKFRWSPLHLTSTELAPRRFEADALMDAAWSDIARCSTGSVDLVSRLEAAAVTSDSVKALFREVAEIPTWVDWGKVQHGQRVFQKYMLHASVTLLYSSLIGGFSSGAIVKVLLATGYLAHPSPRRVTKRVMETAAFVFAVCLDVKPGSAGWQAAIKVRGLHAAVRRRLGARNRSWDSAGHRGVAINQEDMCVTLLAFSDFVLHGIERLAGNANSLSLDDKESYIHLWRYVGYLLGVSERYNPCTSVETARASAESICMHIVEPDHDSRRLVHHLLKSSIVGGEHGFVYRAEIFRFMVGDTLADLLQIPKRPSPSWKFRIFRTLFRVYSSALQIPFFDKVMTACNVAVMRYFVRHLEKGATFNTGFAAPTSSTAKCPMR